MLDPLDKELESRGHQFARYADDFTILVRNQRAGERGRVDALPEIWARPVSSWLDKLFWYCQLL